MNRPPASSQGSDEFFALVYDELRTIAHARIRGERPGYTLQTTELVHEAYLRLAPDKDDAWAGRGHFFAAAAEAMRRILIERARSGPGSSAAAIPGAGPRCASPWTWSRSPASPTTTSPRPSWPWTRPSSGSRRRTSAWHGW